MDLQSTYLSVIPAKAGIHSRLPFEGAAMLRQWIPAFAGMTVEGGIFA
jgi:hypothetical protein